MVFFDEKKLDACEDTLRKTVDLRNGRVSVTDGPFAETNEQIGGSFEVRPIGPLCDSRSDRGDRPH